MKKRKPAWPKSRLRELTLLEDLLRHALQLEDGNRHAWRCAKIIRAAGRLDASYFQTGRLSFVQFLDHLACPEVEVIEPKRAQKRKGK